MINPSMRLFCWANSSHSFESQNRRFKCQLRPTNITKTSFVMNITNLGYPDDIKKDSFGKWSYSGSHIVPFHACIFDDGHIDVERCAPGASGSNVYYLWRLHSVHPSNSSCRRLIALIAGIISIWACCRLFQAYIHAAAPSLSYMYEPGGGDYRDDLWLFF